MCMGSAVPSGSSDSHAPRRPSLSLASTRTTTTAPANHRRGGRGSIARLYAAPELAFVRAMNFDPGEGLHGMTDPTQARTTVSDIGVAMFAVADQDAALAFYTEKLGFEVRSDVRFGENEEMRWLEVAPPGSRARLALNPPMRDEPGGSAIGVETADVRAEHERLSSIDGVTIDTPPMDMGGAPPMFSIADPDGNHIWIVQTPPAA